MERIKDFKKVLLASDGVLARVVEEKTGSGLILPDSVTKIRFDHMVVLTVGTNVTDLKEGDIILDVKGGATTYQIDEDLKIAVLYRGNINIAVPEDNFDPSLKKQSFTSKLIN